MQQTEAISTLRVDLKTRLAAYWSLIKSLQTGLLVFTGLAGYLSIARPAPDWATIVAAAGSLFLAVSGSTILNMVYDRDIDGIMSRTAHRPLPSGILDWRGVTVLGLLVSFLGVGWATMLAPLYGFVVFAGIFLDVIIYTVWLKRRSPWSVVWGGISGGMPVLAGRALATGQIDLVGLMLALAVLLWIPTHTLTYSIKYAEDYAKAKVPVFPNVIGEAATRRMIAISTIFAAVILSIAAWQIGLAWGWLHATVVLGAVLIIMALAGAIWPSSKLNHVLFKFASVYMLAAMGLIIAGV